MIDLSGARIGVNNNSYQNKTELTKALQEGKGEIAQEIIDFAPWYQPSYARHCLPGSGSYNQGCFTEQERWQIKVFKNIDFKNEEFTALNPKLQSLIYRTANNLNKIALVARLNSLCNFSVEDSCKIYTTAPSILSQSMDVATVHQTLLGFLTKLHREGRLLVKLESCTSNTRSKEFFERILGTDHLLRLIQELELKCIKVPKKKAIVKSGLSSINFTIDEYRPGLIGTHSDDIYIQAQEIESVDRFLSREEIVELFTIIEKSNYTDLNADNFIVASDGVYFIDTEFKSFMGNIQWEKMERLLCFVSDSDQEFFKGLMMQKFKSAACATNERPLSFMEARWLLGYLIKREDN